MASWREGRLGLCRYLIFFVPKNAQNTFNFIRSIIMLKLTKNKKNKQTRRKPKQTNKQANKQKTPKQNKTKNKDKTKQNKNKTKQK